MEKIILLNCVPPATTIGPSPGLSILKTHLKQLGYTVKIIYWNILLKDIERDFLWNKYTNDTESLLYAAYLAVKYNDRQVYREVKTHLKSIAPIMLNESAEFFDTHIHEYVQKLDDFFNKYLATFDFNNVLYCGFQMKMDQWIVASIIADKIKILNKNLPIVVGGINTPKIAKDFLTTFNQFDYAIWGEGEYPLADITQFLLENKQNDHFDIASTYYRKDGKLYKSAQSHIFHTDLSQANYYPDYDDFFEFKNGKNLHSAVIFIEGGRGCHWSRCHFCYLNYGYKHRLKDVNKITSEIRYMLEKHGICRFEFLDNDVIGDDMARYHLLLNSLIEIKRDNPNFNIIAVEVITVGLSYDIIKMMAQAGIKTIQIGYECASDSLLKKIDKKNSFASNLNCVKHCSEVGIQISGANLIYNLLEETEDDIHESIDNLRFFRFILDVQNSFVHTPIPLMINSSSKYYNKIIGSEHLYIPNLLPYHKVFINLCQEKVKWSLFEYSKCYKNNLWQLFTDVQYYYIKNKYTYSFDISNGKNTFYEYHNDDKIEQIELDDILMIIIQSSYNRVISLDELVILLPQETPINLLKSKIDFLFSKGLVYRTQCYSEITSIVRCS